MRRRHIQGRDLRRAPQQIDLFSPVRPEVAAGTPGWIDLPVQTREALTPLMVRLLLEHDQNGQVLPAKEAGDDR